MEIYLQGNAELGKIEMLFGLFHYYDYFDTQIFELATTSFGGGLLTKLPLSKKTNLYTNFHLGVVPFGGASVGPVSDTAQSRDYRFAYGVQGKIETGVTIGKYATVSFWYYWYLMHAFDNTGNDEKREDTWYKCNSNDKTQDKHLFMRSVSAWNMTCILITTLSVF